MKLYACSTNPGKLKDFVIAARETAVIDIEPLPSLKEIPAPIETGSTYEENAIIKALHYSRYASELVIADDSGLEVEALGGAPGIYSARYAGPNATADENNLLLLRSVMGKKNRAARYVCVAAIARSGQLLATVTGMVDGTILDELRGSNGFGYDPLFFYEPLHRTFGELANDERVAVNHRGKALRSLFERLAFDEETHRPFPPARVWKIIVTTTKIRADEGRRAISCQAPKGPFTGGSRVSRSAAHDGHALPPLVASPEN